MSHEEPAWVLAKADQRVALLEEMVADLPPVPDNTVILMPLSDMPPGVTDKTLELWERTCDNCQTYVKKGQPFFARSAYRHLQCGLVVELLAGCCNTCKDLT